MFGLHVLVQEVLDVERLLAHGAAERLAVGGQVTLQFHLTGEALRTEQAAVRLGQVKVVHPHMHLENREGTGVTANPSLLLKGHVQRICLEININISLVEK